MEQLNLFAEPELTGREKDWAEFLRNHPFQFHLLRVRNGLASHQNSLYKDYNATDNDLNEYENSFTKRVICLTAESLVQTMENSPARGRQVLYILTPLDWEEVRITLGALLHE